MEHASPPAGCPALQRVRADPKGSARDLCGLRPLRQHSPLVADADLARAVGVIVLEEHAGVHEAVPAIALAEPVQAAGHFAEAAVEIVEGREVVAGIVDEDLVLAFELVPEAPGGR